MFCTRKTIWNSKNSQNGRKWLYWKPFFTTIYFKHWYSIELLSPLSQSVFDVENTEAFIQEFKNMLPPDDYNLISFDVTSLFKNVLLDYTINIILKQIYDQRELLETKISRKEMKDLLLLRTKVFLW